MYVTVPHPLTSELPEPRVSLHTLIARTVEDHLRTRAILREHLDPDQQAAQIADAVTALFARVYYGGRGQRVSIAAHTELDTTQAYRDRT